MRQTSSPITLPAPPMFDEVDISAEKTPAQHDTEELIRQISQQPTADCAPTPKAGVPVRARQ